ncbi:uncharacterized protein G2W53_015084 [Senna tora]|uniref:Uncharacterized protein n=1 Tax=Senna tora TaxID=362788 RepID=A0A835C3N1_9FABA|nr:uncharacterized protein G2W53_015084 [Senna tora]
MATGQISRRRGLVASNLAGENTEVLRVSEGEEASTAAEEFLCCAASVDVVDEKDY